MTGLFSNQQRAGQPNMLRSLSLRMYNVHKDIKELAKKSKTNFATRKFDNDNCTRTSSKILGFTAGIIDLNSNNNNIFMSVGHENGESYRKRRNKKHLSITENDFFFFFCLFANFFALKSPALNLASGERAMWAIFLALCFDVET